MAVAAMKKLTLVAHAKDKRKILKTLVGLGTAEVAASKDYDKTVKCDDAGLRAEFERKLNRVSFAFSFMKDTHRELNKLSDGEKAPEIPLEKLNLKRENKLIEYDDMISEVTENEHDLFSIISDLEDYNTRLTDIKTETARLTHQNEQLRDYLDFDIKFSSVKDTQRVAMFLGLIKGGKKEILLEGATQTAVLKFSGSGDGVFAMCLKEEKEQISKLLIAADFSRCPFTQDFTAKELTDKNNQRINELAEARLDIYKQAASAFKYAYALKVLYDYYFIELAKLDALARTAATSKAFVLEAWVTASAAELTQSKIKEAAPSAEIFVSDPQKGDSVPTYIRSNKFVSPFGINVTAMYGIPKYGELDPNPFVAFFYFLFFGFMLGDAGYGIILSLACFAYLLFRKPVKNSGSFILMFGLCGLSTILWGAIFGGWFSIESQYLQGSAIGRFLLNFKLIDPLSGSQALVMFGMALGLGVIQIAAGFFLSGVTKFRANNKLDAIFNDFSWVVILLGFIVLVFDLLGILKTSVAGIVIALTGLAMLIVGGALGKKNPVKMFIGAFKNVYGGINVFADILSYARLFGLGLTTGVIGMVINKIGALIIDLIPYAGYAIAAVVLLGGHAFNLLINLLGVYVHNCRLQYVEFFGKFYGGEGRAFAPLGSKTKYVYLTDKLETANNTKTNKLEINNNPTK